MLKICTKCKIEKSLEDFNKNARTKDGLTPQCKSCRKIHRDAVRGETALKDRAYYEAHREEFLLRAKTWRETHPDEVLSYRKTYRAKNAENLRIKDQAYRKRNIERLSERRRRYYQTHRDEALRKAAEWARNNQDQANANKRNWAEKNPVKASEAGKSWRNSNPTKRMEMKNRRRARLANNGVYVVGSAFLERLYSSPCVMCGSLENISADHIIPIARGGTHSESNLQPLCGSCNSSKRDRTMTEWKYAIRKRARNRD